MQSRKQNKVLTSSLSIASGSLCFLILSLHFAHAERVWQKCAFNNRLEDCEVAGSTYLFTVTYRLDGKQIQV